MGKINLVSYPMKIALTGKTVYVTRPVRYSLIDTDELITMVAGDAGIQETQVSAAYLATVRQIEQLVLNGHSVRLGKIGIISLSVKAKSVERKEDVSASNIRQVGLLLRPSSYLKEKIAQTQFSTSITNSDPDESKG